MIAIRLALFLVLRLSVWVVCSGLPLCLWAVQGAEKVVLDSHGHMKGQISSSGL